MKDQHWDTQSGALSRACTLNYSPSSDKNCSIRRGWQSWNWTSWAECSVMPGHETRRSKLYWFWQHHYLSNWLPLNGDWIFFNIWCASSSTWPKTEKTEDVPGTSQLTLRGDLQGKHFFSTILHAEPPVLDTTPCSAHVLPHVLRATTTFRE